MILVKPSFFVLCFEPAKGLKYFGLLAASWSYSSDMSTINKKMRIWNGDSKDFEEKVKILKRNRVRQCFYYKLAHSKWPEWQQYLEYLLIRRTITIANCFQKAIIKQQSAKFKLNLKFEMVIDFNYSFIFSTVTKFPGEKYSHYLCK